MLYGLGGDVTDGAGDFERCHHSIPPYLGSVRSRDEPHRRFYRILHQISHLYKKTDTAKMSIASQRLHLYLGLVPQDTPRRYRTLKTDTAKDHGVAPPLFSHLRRILRKFAAVHVNIISRRHTNLCCIPQRKNAFKALDLTGSRKNNIFYGIFFLGG
ncbi:hypothetical protein EDD15DRAFT_2272637 [Pisolithus albus]|nr:hypothetical protein EDD15DRAFT_2272637 [Pisolithus albus]